MGRHEGMKFTLTLILSHQGRGIFFSLHWLEGYEREGAFMRLLRSARNDGEMKL